MLTKDFDFVLPPELIALRPVEPRDCARLMVIKPDGTIVHRTFKDLGDYLVSGDILSFNDSRVIAARLIGIRPPRQPGSPAVQVEVTLHRRTGPGGFLAFAKPARRLKRGDCLDFGPVLKAQIIGHTGGEIELAFDLNGKELDDAIANIGAMPLPPYIASRRAPDGRDFTDYQTVYAAHDGSVAAPTAGLHFTRQLLDQLQQKGVELAALTLHVGAGTFLPVTVENASQHRMHAEHAILDERTAARFNFAHAQKKRIAAVGTTTLRTLETAADETGQIKPFDSDTSIFITPGYKFKAVDMLVTNFHLPRSTLFMLVSAFMGLEVMQHAYAEAIRERYRFYSYGDACLLIRPQ